MLSGFDHVTIAVSHPESAIANYERLLGAAPRWRGQHPELGTQAALFALANALVEIVGPRVDAPEAQGLRELLTARGEGVQAIAFATEDAAACTTSFRARGVRATLPQPGQAHGDDGSVREYRTVEFSSRNTRGLSVFAVERSDLAQLLAAPADHSTACALDHVVIRSADPDAAVAFYRDALGVRLALDRELAGHRMLFFRIGGVTIEVVQEPSLGSEDSFYGLAFRARDLEQAHRRLQQSGIGVSEIRPGNKPGTRVFSVRDHTHGVPTLVLHDPARND